MKKVINFTIGIAAIILFASCSGIYSNGSFTWEKDSMVEGGIRAYAPDKYTIISNYPESEFESGEWHLSEDISGMPVYSAPTVLEEAIFNLALEEAVKAVEPDSTLRTGVNWGGVWTRDVSYSIVLGFSTLQTEASKKSLLRKVDRLGRIIQDTGTGGSWPCSTDRQIWVMAAWEIYKVTGDKEWLETIYPIVKRSLEDDRLTIFDTATGMVRGESSFLDWRKQEYPLWMGPADIYMSENLGTECAHYAAWEILSEMEARLGSARKAAEYRAIADGIRDGINDNLWVGETGWYAQYLYGRRNPIPSPRFETLGEALTILLGIAGPERSAAMVASAPCQDFGIPCFYPQIKSIPPYHNDAMWPFVQGYWNKAAAKVGNPDAVLHGIACIYRMASFFLTNKENVVIYNGKWKGTRINSSRQLWSIAGASSSVLNVLIGLDFAEDTLVFHPLVPKQMAGTRRLSNLKWRDAVLDITVKGYGAGIKSFTLDGNSASPFLSAGLEGSHSVEIVLDGKFPSGGINMVDNLYTPSTPAAQKVIGSAEGPGFVWASDADEFIILKDGEPFDTVGIGHYKVRKSGEYQVIAVGKDGWNSFAGEPLEYFEDTIVKETGDIRISRSENTHLDMNVNVPCEGEWFIDFCFCNDKNNFENDNKCANRTLLAGGKVIGTVVFPQGGRGLSDYWQWSNSLKAHLPAGNVTISLEFRPENENMNIDVNECTVRSVRLSRLGN
ncbi:MAG: hypothetical protein MJY62_03035 [Bacteroidales bacterium]|nr:hypothetical protein [Bacteroidales bacterium]